VHSVVICARIAEVLLLVQDGHHVPLVPDQGLVQQFTMAAAHSVFHDRVHRAGAASASRSG
jgi:hypothetical protein